MKFNFYKMKKYVLNLNVQSNGDYEVHETNCNWAPVSNYENLGYHHNCKDAVVKAKKRHPNKRINGCYYCSRPCHTT